MTRTLIVDDEEDMRVLIRTTIEQADHGLLVDGEAGDGIEAIDKWREQRPDVVILDQRMPGLTGLEAAERILKEEPEQPIILFSAFLTEAVRQGASRLGIRACLDKDRIFDLPETLWSVTAA